jgi:drug/metabolite transporter (DMT)-like permease
MTAASLIRLVALSAIWGASFLFMRISAPVLGPAWLIFARVGLAALFLLAVASILRKPLQWRQNGKHYVILGFFNSALPFLLFAFAARTVSASLLSVLNATAPIWGAAIGAIWLRTALTPRMLLGMLLGIAGVALLAGVEALSLPDGGGLAMLAGLAAPGCYGLATTYTKTARAVEPFANAHGNLWAATVMLVPVAALAPIPSGLPTPTVMGAVVALGVLCSGVAYLLYFRLIRDIGATSALTVTFLIPVFGILWGVLFLHEQVGWHTLFGTLIVLAGTILITGFGLHHLIPGRGAAPTRSA